MIGTGRRKRPASIRDKICVLSPISARPTDHGRYEEGFHAGCHGGRAGGKPWHSSLRPTRVQGTDAKGLAKPVGSVRAIAERVWASEGGYWLGMQGQIQ